LRTLAVAYQSGTFEVIDRESEKDMIFLGFITITDPPKPGIDKTIQALRQRGVMLKIITGDNRLVATHISQAIGLLDPDILTGADLHTMSDAALRRRVAEVEVFAEVGPAQKSRVIQALQRAGYVVGYLGDGINDAPALHQADVSISVNSAVDVAKEAADIVLLEKDLNVLQQGVSEGRKTFANTLKYVFMATSANFGNMFSVAGASLFLPFLPLLPKQILLTNLMTDFPEMAIATDHVDKEFIALPHRWNIRFIRNFMMTFGLISSVFDYLTFGVLLYFRADIAQFRTAWFTESVISACLIVLVIRSRKSFITSNPGRYLLIATLAIIGLTLLLPLTPLHTVLGFTVLQARFHLLIALIVLGYVLAAEMAKRVFYRRMTP
jgi:P-type Mg2+ transporter